MIRITELALPLDYPPEALRQAVLKRLPIPDADLLDVTLFKRSYDARKKTAASRSSASSTSPCATKPRCCSASRATRR